MTRSLGTLATASAALAAALFVGRPAPAAAQCATCVTPTVAYSPVVVQPQTTIVRTGWYPGYLLDRLRLRRWSTVGATAAVAPAPTYSVGYAPAYTAAYTPSYTAAYAPATYTAGYTPYITAYAPLQPAVVQASYAVPAVSSACSACPQPTTVSYAPTTVYRPVEVAPVCTTCTVASPCNACSACATGVSQVSYVEGAAAPADCPGCAPASGAPVYDYGTATPPTPPQGGLPQPELPPGEPEPADQTYGAQRPAGENGTTGSGQAEEKSVVPRPGEDDATGPEADPAAEADPSAANDYGAPQLLDPRRDPMANRPTVDVHNAVYRQPARQGARVSTASAKVAATDGAGGWYSVKDRE